MRFISEALVNLGWDPVNWFNPVNLLCLSQVRMWNLKVMYCGRFVFKIWR